MIKYFKELLETLKKIEKHLERLSLCVVERRKGGHGDKFVIATKRGNDSY